MTVPALPMISGISAAYACLISSAAFVYFRQKGNTLAEAGAYGLMVMIMLQSWLAQLLLMIGHAHLLPAAHLALCIAAIAALWRNRRLLQDQWHAILDFVSTHWLAGNILAIGTAGLAAVWLIRIAAPISRLELLPGYLLGPGHIFSAVPGNPEASLFVLNHVALLSHRHHLFAAAAANLSALLAIALSTYALARRYSWAATALTAALLVVSMPRLVHQSLAAHSELGPAAAALLAVLALYRTVEEPHVRDAAMLLSAISFSVSGGRLCYLMPAVLTALSLLVLSRRHDLRLWPQALRRHPLLATLTGALVLVFSQLPVIAANLFAGRAWIGQFKPAEIVFNADGLRGAAANMVRYLVQSIHFPQAFDRFSQWAFGFSGPAVLNRMYHLLAEPIFNAKGAAAAFQVSWASTGSGWFGPVGFLLILPSLAYAFRRGPHRLKTTAWTLCAYWVLVALIAAWQPSNVRLLTPFFVCAGFTMAFFLPPWRVGRKGCFALQLLCILLLAADLLS